MRRWLGILIALAALVVSATADASASRYLLRHPKHEHCRAHYERRVEHVRVGGHRVALTYCVRVAPREAPTSTHAVPPAPPTLASTLTLVSAENFPFQFAVSGSVRVLGGADLIGTPITFAIANWSSGQTLGSFTWPSDAPQPCALVYTIQGLTQTFTGEAKDSDPGCPLAAPVSMPTGQIPVLTGSFGGNGADAPSVSEGKGL